MRITWRKLVDVGDEVTLRVAKLQVQYKRRLLTDIRNFIDECVRFRDEYVSHGPSTPGLSPQEAMDRLRCVLALCTSRSLRVHACLCSASRQCRCVFPLQSVPRGA